MIEKGCVVVSTAGRDFGKLFIVLDIIDENYCLIADGKLRRVQNPKKKKMKHVRFVCENSLPIFDKIMSGADINDAEIRKALAILSQKSQIDLKEGCTLAKR
jgi:large subunit ribosomal protein L14e